MRLTDAHAHLDSIADRTGIRTLMCATDPEGAEALFAVQADWLIRCAALHPWKADRWRVSDMLPYMDQCPVVGEIGLDSVWCEVDMAKQIAAFESQLSYAERAGKPVVLHTKGCEKDIARRLRGARVKKLVHWFSAADGLDDYLALDCYFTVGPDVGVNPCVAEVARRAPLDRILVETDGMGAVVWALGKAMPPRAALEASIRTIARLRGLEPEALSGQMEDNFDAFLG